MMLEALREPGAAHVAHALVYLVAVSFLVLFVPFWKWVFGRSVPHRATEAVREPSRSRLLQTATGWFSVPDGVALHPGHSWARPEADGTVAVGLDELAERLVGPLDRIELPREGTRLGQGEVGWTLVADGKRIPMLSPVQGTVVAVHERVAGDPAPVSSDPYGRGWLLRLLPDRLVADSRQLLSGESARRMLDDAAQSLHLAFSPAVGPVAADGGAPVAGLARALDPDRWDRLACEVFRTEPPAPAGKGGVA